MNIALISPNKDVYSETFIQAHKDQLKGNIFYYYNGQIPTELEGGIVINSRRKRIIDIFKGHFRLNRFSLEEQAILTSFKKNNIDLVFAEYGFTGESLIPVCKELGLPLIVHFHGYDASCYDILSANNNYVALFDYATYVIVVSQKMKKDLLELGCHEDKLVYNVYGPREEFLALEPLFSKPQFIAIGRFVDKKAPYYLILSFREVLKKYPKAQLVIAGDGDLWNTCSNLIKYYGLENNVILPGVITQQEFIEYLQESVAMVQHSVTAKDGNMEGTPVAILEALAAGVPVISTRHAGIPDIITNDVNGLLVEEHDVKGFSLKMSGLLDDPDLARRLGKNARLDVQKNYTMNRHISKLDELIASSVQPNP